MSTTAARKRAYHHGDLKAALTDAAEHLVHDQGPEGFTMADASRMAGVSTAAPYRHFADRHALLEAVAARGFERLAETIRTAREPWPDGSVDEFVAGGKAYVRFAEEQPAVFRLMFGNTPDMRSAPLVDLVGKACFGGLLEAVATFTAANDLRLEDPLELALPIWSLVHGVASLSIDNAYPCATDRVVDTDALLDSLQRAFLTGWLAEKKSTPETPL